MKKLNDELSYDETLSFEEQTQEVQEYINEFINGSIPDICKSEPAGHFPRPLLEVWNIGELKVTNTYNYKYPATHEKNGEHSMGRSYN